MQKLRRYGGKIERCSALLDSARPGAQQRWAQRRDVGQLRERRGTGERVGTRVGNRYRQDIEYRTQLLVQIGVMDVMTEDRKSCVSGKRESVSVDFGGGVTVTNKQS